MKITVNLSRFIDEFNDSSRAGNFSYEGLVAIYEYLEQDDEDYELDIVDICSRFCEDTFDGVAETYGLDLNKLRSREDKIQAIKEFLEDNTSVILHDDEAFIYINF